MRILARSLLQNKLGEQDASSIVEVAKGKPQITTLCGLKQDQTKAHFSGRDLGVGDAILLAFDLKQNSVLAELECARRAQHTASAPTDAH
jgi:hypothetical protein